ncbi:sigma-70 family RNA polymerase sigma factor [Coraliomargarita akajimensis]|nr:sigma-70 family RNA polymerase sigma factor [Coraliomargarita akajimensis]
MQSTLHNTSHTLLAKVHDLSDHQAWNTFVAKYQRFICHILRQSNIAPSDVDDLCQQILLKLTKSIGNYDRSRAKFRTWLAQLIRNTLFDHYRKVYAKGEHIDSEALSGSLEDEQSSQRMEQHIEQEWALFIVNTAMTRVEGHFRGDSVEVYRLTLKGLSADAIAQQKGLTVSTVYSMNKRVKAKVYQEIRKLQQELEYEF